MEKSRVVKIGVIGAESTGKTSLCESLAQHFETVWVPEYAREYFTRADIYNYSSSDLEIIALKQMQNQEKMEKEADTFLFCDTTLITLKIWAELEFEMVPDLIAANLKNEKFDHYLITDNQLPWIEDELRLNKFDRDMILEMNINEVKKLGGRYSFVSGQKKERENFARHFIETIQ
jgi:NadR type nicotinamide-nucleotide adenylyltransferase